VTLREALAAGTARLASAGIPDAARDARRLMAEAIGVAADRLTLLAGEVLPADTVSRYDGMVGERARFRPVAQIVGRRAFWGRTFAVSGAVLDPRPETETLVALAVAGSPAARVLDLGTGSGAILVTLLAEWPAARGVGTDIDAAALAVAAANAARHGVSARAEFREADWTGGIDGKSRIKPSVNQRRAVALSPISEVRKVTSRSSLGSKGGKKGMSPPS
jgi:release factor glutamine methyltransferase